MKTQEIGYSVAAGLALILGSKGLNRAGISAKLAISALGAATAVYYYKTNDKKIKKAIKLGAAAAIGYKALAYLIPLGKDLVKKTVKEKISKEKAVSEEQQSSFDAALKGLQKATEFALDTVKKHPVGAVIVASAVVLASSPAARKAVVDPIKQTLDRYAEEEEFKRETGMSLRGIGDEAVDEGFFPFEAL